MTRGALYAQAIRGPVVLITVGTLFALHQAGTISFGRTWPLIIIVVGVIKLLERLLAPPQVASYAQPGYAQPGYAQPGYSQPGYSQPPNYPPTGDRQP